MKYLSKEIATKVTTKLIPGIQASFTPVSSLQRTKPAPPIGFLRLRLTITFGVMKVANRILEKARFTGR